jgi:hypothetical protein
MANVAFHQFFSSPVVTTSISRLATPRARLGNFWGTNIGGPNTSDVGGIQFGWDIFDRVREIAKGRPHGTGPSSVAPNPVGHVSATAYRAHEKVHLAEARIFRTRGLGQPWGSIDVRGQRYVLAQQERIAQRFRNHREFLISRLMRGGFDILISGDDMIPVDTGNGHIAVSFQIPAGNKSQLDMLGAGDILNVSWATVGSADIPTDIIQINAAFEQLHGRPLRHAWCDGATILYVMNNAKMQSLAGTANRVFQTFTPSGVVGPDGIQDTGFTVVFNAIPWLVWHVYESGLDVNGTYTKYWPTGVVGFTSDPDPGVVEWYEGSEVVAENVMDPGSERYGFAAWNTRVIDPAGFEMKALDVGLPVLYIPKAIAYATVVF